MFLVLQESVATLSGTLPGLMAGGDQEEEAEGTFNCFYKTMLNQWFKKELETDV